MTHASYYDCARNCWMVYDTATGERRVLTREEARAMGHEFVDVTEQVAPGYTYTIEAQPTEGEPLLLYSNASSAMLEVIGDPAERVVLTEDAFCPVTLRAKDGGGGWLRREDLVGLWLMEEP